MNFVFGAGCGVAFALGLVLVTVGMKGGQIRPSRHLTDKIRHNGLMLGIGIVAGAVGLLATGWPVAAVMAGLFAIAAPRLFGSAGRQRSEVDRTEAIAGWAEMLRDTMAGAAGIEQAIINTASVAPEAIRPEVRALGRRLERQSLTSALAEFADDVAHPTADLIVAALTLASKKHAKRLGELLGSLAAAARQDATMRLRVEAGRARTQTSVRVVVGATVSMAFGLMVLNRGYLEPYGTPVGQLVLAAVGFCFGAAFWWLDRMRSVEAPGRIFARQETA